MLDEFFSPGFTNSDRMFDDVARLLNSAWANPWRTPSNLPVAELWSDRQGDEAALTMEVPGCKPEDLEISISGNSLSLKGRRRTDVPEPDAIWLMRERADATWNQTINLPFEVAPGQEQASCQDGVLTLRCKRSDKDRPRRIPLATR